MRTETNCEICDVSLPFSRHPLSRPEPAVTLDLSNNWSHNAVFLSEGVTGLVREYLPVGEFCRLGLCIGLVIGLSSNLLRKSCDTKL